MKRIFLFLNCFNYLFEELSMDLLLKTSKKNLQINSSYSVVDPNLLTISKIDYDGSSKDSQFPSIWF